MNKEDAINLSDDIRMANAVTGAIILDLKGRSGFDDWWYGIETDVRDEMEAELFTAALKAIERENYR